jgi:GDP-4-dehydro-6-deoxy-D-mannose reductase
MTTLVTGAASPLGRHLVSWLRATGSTKVVGVARQPRPEENVVACDVTDRASLAAVVESARPSLIFHLAADYGTAFEASLAVNAGSAQTLLETVASLGLGARVVLIGSAAEYGAVRPEENPVTEDRVLAPVSLYGMGKAIQTQVASHYARHRGCDVVVARPFNLRMPGLADRLFMGRLEQSIAAVRSGRQATVKVGNLDAVRDYVDVDDAIRQIMDIAAKGVAGGVYHVASGRPTRMGDLLDEMLLAAGLDRGIVERVPAQAVRPGYDVPAIYADITRTLALRSG